MDTIEKHTVSFQNHVLMVNGTMLKERKEVATFWVEGEDEPYRTTVTHNRSIGDNYYQVFEVLEGKEVTDHQVTTSLKDEEVETFQQEWNEKWNPAVNEDVVSKAQETSVAQGESGIPSSTMLLKRDMRNLFEENKKEAAAEHGSLYDPLHILNKRRHDEIDHIFIEKDYHSGGKYIRQLNPETGKTLSFYYETSSGNVFYQVNEPEPRTRYYHNKKTGKKTTVNMRTGETKTEYLKPNIELPEEHENEGVHPFLDPEMAQLEKEVEPLLEKKEK